MRTFASVLVGALLVAGLVAATPTEPTCAVLETEEPGWGSNRPSPPNRDNRTVGSGAEEYVALSVDQQGGAAAVVADVSSLQVTHNAGCSWQVAWTFGRDLDPTADIEPSTARFTDVAIASGDAAGQERIVALVYDLDSFASARIRTLVSEDGGATFEVGGQGLPDALELPGSFRGCDQYACQLAIAPSDPEVVYLSIRALRSTLFYRSDDGGRTFTEPGSDVGALSESTTVNPAAFVVDPLDADVLWGFKVFDDVLQSSTDGGRTWVERPVEQAIEGRVNDVLGVAMTHTDDGREVLAVLDDRDGQRWTVLSEDGGSTFVGARDFLDSEEHLDVVGAHVFGQFVASTDEGAYRFDPVELAWIHLGGRSLGPLRDVAPIAGTTTVWFRGPQTLPVTGDLQFVIPFEPEISLGVPAFDPLNPVGRLPGTLVVPDQQIVLNVGQTVRRDVVLDLPRTPTPLDVFFLFDQSGSMTEEMEALARGMAEITNELTRRRISVWVGLGGYSDGWRYQLHRDIGPPDAEFQRALDGLGTGGGTETAYTAMHQVATGTGLESNRAGLGPPEGWNANWRNGAVRLVVNLTDERLQVEAEPTVQETIEALQDQRIRVINLISAADVDVSTDTSDDPTSLDRGVQTDDPTFGPAAELSLATGAVGPPSGVDCGGDGEIDIREGEPLSCYLHPLIAESDGSAQTDGLLPNLADVVVEVLDGVTEVHEIEFFTDFNDVLVQFEPLDDVLVDIRDPQVIRAEVLLTCPPRRAGQILTPKITAVASSRHLAAASMEVACLGGPVVAAPAPPEVPAPVGPAPQPAAAAAPPAPPPPPATVTVSAGATAQAPGAATTLVPQVGVAAVTQQEQQVQTASLGPGTPQSPGEQPDIAFEFSARRDRNDAPVTLAIGAAMTLGAGALARRRRTVGAHRVARLD